MFFAGAFPSEIFLLVLETREIKTILSFYNLFLLLFHNHSSLLTVVRKLLLSTDDLCTLNSVIILVYSLASQFATYLDVRLACFALQKGIWGSKPVLHGRTHARLVESSVVQAYLYFLTWKKRNAWYEATGIYSLPRRCLEKERETGKLVVERKSSSMFLLLLMIKQQGQCGMIGLLPGLCYCSFWLRLFCISGNKSESKLRLPALHHLAVWTHETQHTKLFRVPINPVCMWCWVSPLEDLRSFHLHILSFEALPQEKWNNLCPSRLYYRQVLLIRLQPGSTSGFNRGSDSRCL